MQQDSVLAINQPSGVRSHNETGARSRIEVGPFIGAALKIDPKTEAESYTWLIEPNPWTIVSTTGTPLWEMSEIKVTKVRAPLTDGGYSAFVTVTFTIKSLGYYSYYNHNPPIKWYVDLFNFLSGGLTRIEGSTVLDCNTARSVFFTQDINPDVYDIAGACHFCFHQNLVYSCSAK
jgi:hypothetical protein